MNALQVFATAAVFAALATPLVFSGDAQADAPRPNVIVIVTDDQGYADLSCQGVVSDVRTPNIDALARDGVRMTAGYVTAPQCAPTRAALLVGRYQGRFGLESNQSETEGFEAERTLAQRLRDAGYSTGMVGKWHLGKPGQLDERGFDDFLVHPGRLANFDLAGRDTVGRGERSKDYHVDRLTDAACAFIGRHLDEPFFLYLAYQAPHVPLSAPKKYLERFDGVATGRRKLALAMLAAVDDGVGRIRATLREHELEGRTLVFLVSDHGAPLLLEKSELGSKDEGWNGSLNTPLGGEKGMLSEGGIRVPFLVSWKGGLPGGLVYDAPVSALDIAATTLAAVGLAPDERADGVDLLPFLRGERTTEPHAALFWRFGAQAAIREGSWKLLRAGRREYLFDLAQDLEERNNLAASEPARVRALAEKLAAWAATLTPAGLEDRELPHTLATYYDFYHEPVTVDGD